MSFEKFAERAGRAVTDAASRSERPDLGLLRRTRRRRVVAGGTLAALLGVATFLGIGSVWPGPQDIPPAGTQSTTTTALSTSTTTTSSTTTTTSRPTTTTSSPPTTTMPSPSGADVSLVEAFVEFAQTGTAESFSQLPLADSVDLGLGPQIELTVEADDLQSPSSWVIDAELFRAYVGPFSALMLLEQADDFVVRVGPHPHCVSSPQPAPKGLDDHTRLSIQPSDDSIDSCLKWWTVDFFVGPSGLVEAITLDVYEP